MKTINMCAFHSSYILYLNLTQPTVCICMLLRIVISLKNEIFNPEPSRNQIKSFFTYLYIIGSLKLIFNRDLFLFSYCQLFFN